MKKDGDFLEKFNTKILTLKCNTDKKKYPAKRAAFSLFSTILNLFVKTIEKWRDKEKYLQEFGYNDFLE